MSKEMQPIFILPEGSQRVTGRSAQRNNILAAKALAEAVRTTLGPKGMDKMLVDSMGEITITNDGVTILEEMQVNHPAAKMLVEVSRTQEEEIGDGTTTAVVIAGELLKQSENLLDQDIHPTVIARGYRMATVKAHELLAEFADDIARDDTDTLIKIGMTAINGKGAESAQEKLSTIAVRAVLRVAEQKDGVFEFDDDHVKIEKKAGGGVEDSELIEGIIIEKEAVHPSMPRIVKNAKVALVDAAFEIRNTEIDAKISITDPSQMQAFIDQEEKMLRAMVSKVKATGASVLFCQKGIDDIAQHFLAKEGILACRRVKKSDMESLALATSGRVVSNLEDLSAEDLGAAGQVTERRIAGEEMIFVTECTNPKSVSILVRGGTDHIADEAKRALTDAIGDIAAALKLGKVVTGAGATEIELARGLRVYAETLSGREQLAVQAFAQSLEIIPRTLAENAGLDPIDVLTELKAAHDAGSKKAGIDVHAGKIVNSFDAGVIEPLRIKTQAITAASEVAQMILRIDDVIASGQETEHNMPPES
ncbi:thermosome subunit [Candidatus Woesearchaeota archaeon]|nr:thermosome subunit [Candidatus Woesearchaeota archaeon]